MATLVYSCHRLTRFEGRMLFGPGNRQELSAEAKLWGNDERVTEVRKLLATQPEYTELILLVPFSNLTSLRLYELGGILQETRSDLVRVLKRCTGLRELALAISMDTLKHYSMSHEQKEDLGFLSELCSDYATLGGQPIHLKKLHLGLGILFSREDTPLMSCFTATPLRNLTILSALEEVHLENRTLFITKYEVEAIPLYGYFADNEDGLAWRAFTVETTPRLRRLTAY